MAKKSPVLGKFKVSISPDLADFKGVGAKISASFSGVPERMQAQFGKALNGVVRDFEKINEKLKLDDFEVDTEALEKIAQEAEAVGKEAGEKLGEALEDGLEGLGKSGEEAGEDIVDELADELKKGEVGPEAEKLGEKIGEEIEKGADKKTSGLGKKLAGGLGKASIVAGKAVLTGAAAAGAGLAGLAAAAVKNYADYEQYVGGVDKLFGDASESVQANAAVAFKTAGLSANDYMNTVTGFSASLISSLGGDTAKAAALADTAIVDMSDNANTFGTDIESIQNAYSGFAKGNFTMLDNLKLGYGGTAEEMARLVNESGVLGDAVVTSTSVASVGFDTIISAIHATQDSMKIAGTTLAEGSKTITGSYEQMQSGWQNVVTGLAVGGSFLDSALDGFATSVGDFANNVLAILPQVIEGISTMIDKLLPTLLQTISDIIPPLVELLVTGLPVLGQAIADALPGVIDQLVQACIDLLPVLINLILIIGQAILDALPAVIRGIVEFIVTGYPQILNGAFQLLFAIIEAIPLILPPLVAAIPEIIIAIVAALISAIPQLIIACIQLLYALILAIPEIISELQNEFPRIINEMILQLAGANGEMFNAGMEILNGLIDGILSVDWLSPIKQIGDGIVDGFLSLFEVNSPSKLMKREVGKPIGFGVGEGIEDSMPEVDKNLANFSRNIENGINTDIGDIAFENSSATAAAPVSVTVEQTVAKPESMLDLALQAKTGAQLGLETAENLKGRK